MAMSGRYCTWCGLKEMRPENFQEFNEWLAQPQGCRAPDGDGHLWVFPHGYSWKNKPPQQEIEMRYRSVWHDVNGTLHLGVLTNLETARDEARFKQALGLIAWVQDEEDNKIEIGESK